MALFNKKHYEAEIENLRHENSILQYDVSKLKKELVEKDKQLQERRNYKGQAMVERLRDGSRINELEKEVQKKDRLIKRLRAQINEFKQVQSNLRKAGRKSKATEENKAEIFRLREEGYSYAQIAEFITENSGEYISKSTVAKITKEYYRP